MPVIGDAFLLRISTAADSLHWNYSRLSAAQQRAQDKLFLRHPPARKRRDNSRGTLTIAIFPRPTAGMRATASRRISWLRTAHETILRNPRNHPETGGGYCCCKRRGGKTPGGIT